MTATRQTIAWLCVACLSWSAMVAAQNSGPATDVVSAPAVADVAWGLSDPAARLRTLTNLAVVLRQDQRLRFGETGIGPESYSRDLAWIEKLLAETGFAEARGGVLDPAAWLIMQKLQRAGLPPSPSLGPDGLQCSTLLEAVFDRAAPRVAEATLPELFWCIELEATREWARLLQMSETDANRAALLAASGGQWPEFSERGDEGRPAAESRLQESFDAADDLAVLVSEALSEGPPNAWRGRQLRFSLVQSLALLEGSERRVAGAWLKLASLVDGLHQGRYVGFAEGLLTVVAGLLVEPDENTLQVSAWLTNQLPMLSATWARAFGAVDPRINSVLAVAFDVARRQAAEGYLAGEAEYADLADAVAQMSLMVPDIEYYFDLPVRDTIAGSVDGCIESMAQSGSQAGGVMTLALFNDCLESLVRLAETESRAPGLSGDPDGPFGVLELQREVSVTSVQRINYGLGYLHERRPGDCPAPQNTLPNPLEWSTLASLMTWFAEKSPIHFQTQENEQRLARMRAIGKELIDTLSAQLECFAGPGPGSGAPVGRAFDDYLATVLDLERVVTGAVGSFREQALEPGADIALEGDASQSTVYRPENLQVGPCEPGNVCEMSGSLSSTRALLGLFPEPFLIAHQSGLGEVELCYDNMEWIERRSEPVRPGDTNVANYYGRFAFDLKGRYHVSGSVTDVFGFRFASPAEYHYMFAAASEDVLADSCPTEWVGSRIVTPMPHARGGIVPNRLTYLAAPRTLPSRLLAQNWDSGAEWRDWFITGLGVEPIELGEVLDIGPKVTEYLSNLYRLEQDSVYGQLFSVRHVDASGEAHAELEELNTRKGLIRMLMLLFYPQSLLQSDEIRGAIAGQAGLLDLTILSRLRQDNVPVNLVGTEGRRRAERARQAWNGQSERALQTGSIPGALAHASIRLAGIEQRFFAAPVAPVEMDTAEEAVSPEPAASGGD